MSNILQKLKDLVDSLESQDLEEKPEVTEPEPEPEPVPEPEPEPEQDEEEEVVEPFPDYLECSEEETKKVLDILQKQRQHKMQLSELVMAFEAKKQSIISKCFNRERELHETLESLRLEYGVPKDEGYSVNLPVDSSERITFSKGK